jgi:hypothetical protein
MKTHRILGILWLALCCYFVVNLLRALAELHPTAGDMWVAWFVLAGYCLLYFAGIVASIFLFRGARWARWFIAVLAFLEAFATTAYLVTSKSFHVWSSVCIALAVVSLVLLFLPKHEPVA